MIPDHTPSTLQVQLWDEKGCRNGQNTKKGGYEWLDFIIKGARQKNIKKY